MPRPIFLPLKLITPLAVSLASDLKNDPESIPSTLVAFTAVRPEPLPLKLVAVTEPLNTEFLLRSIASAVSPPTVFQFVPNFNLSWSELSIPICQPATPRTSKDIKGSPPVALVLLMARTAWPDELVFVLRI